MPPFELSVDFQPRRRRGLNTSAGRTSDPLVEQLKRQAAGPFKPFQGAEAGGLNILGQFSDVAVAPGVGSNTIDVSTLNNEQRRLARSVAFQQFFRPEISGQQQQAIEGIVKNRRARGLRGKAAEAAGSQAFQKFRSGNRASALDFLRQDFGLRSQQATRQGGDIAPLLGSFEEFFTNTVAADLLRGTQARIGGAQDVVNVVEDRVGGPGNEVLSTRERFLRGTSQLGGDAESTGFLREVLSAAGAAGALGDTVGGNRGVDSDRLSEFRQALQGALFTEGGVGFDQFIDQLSGIGQQQVENSRVFESLGGPLQSRGELSQFADIFGGAGDLQSTFARLGGRGRNPQRGLGGRAGFLGTLGGSRSQGSVLDRIRALEEQQQRVAAGNPFTSPSLLTGGFQPDQDPGAQIANELTFLRSTSSQLDQLREGLFAPILF